MSSNWTRPYQLRFPLDAKQVAEMDAMFQKLFSKVPLSAARGGTGFGMNDTVVGDLFYANRDINDDPIISLLPSVAAGSYLRSGGLLTAPSWSTITLLDTLATGGILYASATNTIIGLAIGAAGTILRSNGTVPAYSSFTIPNTFAQGDILFGSATNVITALAKDASATRYLSNTGAANSPAWAQVSLTSGITGVLPVTAGGTGLSTIGEGFFIQGNAGIYIQTAPGAAGAYLRAASGILIWSTLILPNAATTGDIFVATSTNNMGRLAVGTVGKILRTDGTNPAWSTFTIPNTFAQGDLVYANATSVLVALAKDANATRYLANTGATNNPAWAQIDLSNGITGDLPFANLAQGAALSVLGVTGNAIADNASIVAGTDHQVLRRSGTAVAFGALNLAQAAAITGLLPDANLSTNVPLKNATNAFTGANSFATNAVDLLVGQLKFPATQNASADANTLDDYEEGTFTPTLGGSGGQSGQVYNSQVGTYVKVGQNVFVTIAVGISTLGTITGSVQIQGLPFVAANTIPVPVSWNGLTTAVVLMQGFFTGSSSAITLRLSAVATIAFVTAAVQADMSSSMLLILGFSYRTTA